MAAPDSWLSTKPDAEKLVRALRLGPELISTVEMHRGAYVAWGKELHRMPEGLVLGVPTSVGPMLTTGLFDWDAKLRMALEPFIPRRVYHGDEDESVGAFMSRRLGDEMVTRLAAPLLGGIFAGDADSLSVRAAFPQFVAAERDHGSLIMAMRAQMRARAAKAEAEGEKQPRPGFLSLRGGLGTMIQAVVDDLHGVDVRTSCPVLRVTKLEPDDARGRYAVETGRGTELADDIVFAGPRTPPLKSFAGSTAPSPRPSIAPWTTPRLQRSFSHSNAPRWPRARRQRLHRTAHARPEDPRRHVGIQQMDHRAPGGHVLMRAFLGGAGRDEVLAEDDEELADLALRELRIFTPIDGRPLFSRVFRFHRASPQPYLGHLPRIRALSEQVSHHAGLYIAGSGLDGIGIPDCIRQAETVARQLLS